MKTLIKLNPKRGFQKDFYVFDTETKVKQPNGKYKYGLRSRPENFCFGVIYGWNFHKVITSVKEFQNELMDKRYENKKIFAHNAEYDLGVLFGNIYAMDHKAIFNGRFISATNGNCFFADSYNIYGYSVRNIGIFLGLQKKILEIDESETDTVNEFSDKDVDYCIRDCEVIYKALFDLFTHVGDIKITQASIAMTYYRRNFQPYHIDYNEKLEPFFYDSYFGGRTECFQLGNVNAKVIDINSMYPYAMKNATFPNPKILKLLPNPKVKRVIHYIMNYEGCAKVTVKHKDHYFGHLPYKKDGKLLFPVGEFSGTWNFNELRYAIQSGVIDILECEYLVYAKAQTGIFDKFVNTVYKEKQDAENDLIKTRSKLFLNSLYGKFAQKIDKDFEYIPDINDAIDYIDDLQKKGLYLDIQLFSGERQDCFLVKKSLIAKSLNFCIPSYASYITSFARVMILDELKKCKRSGGKPVYCDTDSIFFEGKYKIEESDLLGKWKTENKIVTEIRGLKNYTSYNPDTMIEEQHIKGVPKKAEKVSHNTYVFHNLVKTKESLVRQIDSGILVKRVKKLTGEYNKRLVLKNGKTKTIKL